MSQAPAAARLCRILKNDPAGELGSVSKTGGGYTSTPEETLKQLLEAHFPGSTGMEPEEVREGEDRSKDDFGVAKRVVTYSRLRCAIDTFAPFKAEGADGVFPALLQRDGGLLSTPLMDLFRTSIAKGYVPAAWRQSRVVFIPKAGKSDYTDTRRLILEFKRTGSITSPK